jgi:hypothetical protein
MEQKIIKCTWDGVYGGDVTIIAATEIYRMCQPSVSDGHITQPLIVIIPQVLSDRKVYLLFSGGLDNKMLLSV